MYKKKIIDNFDKDGYSVSIPNVDDKITVSKGDLIEISSGKKYTYRGNMNMLEIIPKSFEKLEFDEEIIK